MKYKLASDTWDKLEIDAIQRVIDSKQFTMANEVSSFEERFANFHSTRHAIMTNSGSSANLVMMNAIKYLKDDSRNEVIVPAVSWSTTYFPVNQAGYKLIFVDICKDDFNIDIEAVKKAINPNTLGVLTVNLLGNPSKLDELEKICKSEGVYLFEDNCESMGASLNNKLAGTYGLMGTFSFFYSHHMQTMEGGMILTDNDDLADICRSLRAHGWVRDLSEDSTIYKKGQDKFREKFKFILPGFCVRPLEMSGAIGKEQLLKWPAMLKNRRKNAGYINKLMEDNTKLTIQKEYGNSSWFGFGMRVKKGSRNEYLQILDHAGIENRPIVAGNFINNPVMKHLDYKIFGSLDNADDIDENGFFIGNDSKDLTKQIDYFIEKIGATS